MYKKFKPQNLGMCTCSWCGDKIHECFLTVHVSQYENHLFRNPTPVDWFQLCPMCEMKLAHLAIKVASDKD